MFKTIAEAVAIVVLVILLFLGSFRSVLMPVVTIPLSLIGVCSVLLALGYSLNLLSLLAMVLAIGLVVDDAIVVVENIHRHIEEGLTPLDASIIGMKEITGPVVAMTLTLAAVLAPLGFTGGLTGALFREFAFALAGAVIISGVVALTITPTMAARLLKSGEGSRFQRIVDRTFDRVANWYERRVSSSLDYRPITILDGAGAPRRHRLHVHQDHHRARAGGRPGRALRHPERPALRDARLHAPLHPADPAAHRPHPRGHHRVLDRGLRAPAQLRVLHLGVRGLGRPRAVAGGAAAGPAGTAGKVAGVEGFVFSPPTLPGAGGGLPITVVIQSIHSPQRVYEVADEVRQKAQATGRFIVVQNSLAFDAPQVTLTVDRDRAASLNVPVSDVGGTMGLLVGGGSVGQFDRDSNSYDIITQVPQEFRDNPEALGHFFVRAATGEMVPLSAVVSIETGGAAAAIEQFNQLNSATISALPLPGVSTGDGLAEIQRILQETLPEGFFIDYADQSRLEVTQGNTIAIAFALAVLVIYLVLAAQFESFRDPFIILMAVPLSIFGAILPLNVGLGTLNIYSQVGLITLIGLITKHGILLVEFANQQREERGLSRRDAIVAAAKIRLRPILMTTAAMALAVVPLITADGAGAAARYAMGLVIFSGLIVGTCFTLFVVPMFYTLISRPDRAEATAWPELT